MEFIVVQTGPAAINSALLTIVSSYMTVSLLLISTPFEMSFTSSLRMAN